jgi:hypothetical protein
VTGVQRAEAAGAPLPNPVDAVDERGGIAPRQVRPTDPPVPEDEIAGEQDASVGVVQAYVVGGVPRREQDLVGRAAQPERRPVVDRAVDRRAGGVPPDRPDAEPLADGPDEADVGRRACA